ncbi:hypothetical protein ROZALSC1DRAFT_29472, partial [Rozella allomycis CSF55]
MIPVSELSDIKEESFVIIENHDDVTYKSAIDDGTHGGLVKKLMHNTKDAIDYSSDLTTIPKPHENNSNDSEIESVRKQKKVKSIKESLQGYVKNSHMFGKSLDYVQEDLNSMINEFNLWRNELQLKRKEYLDAVKCTSLILEPMNNQIFALKNSILEQ